MICCHGLMHCRTIAENKTHNNDHAPLTRGAVVKVRVVNRLQIVSLLRKKACPYRNTFFKQKEHRKVITYGTLNPHNPNQPKLSFSKGASHDNKANQTRGPLSRHRIHL